MSEQTKDIKDLDLLQNVSDNDRILMTKASEGHAAKVLTFANLKEKVLGSIEKPITSINKEMVEKVLTGNITSHSHAFAGITGKPTTLSGYGITDAVKKTSADTITASRFISTNPTGTAPLSVSSSTLVGNLNADLLDGYHASSMRPEINLTLGSDYAYYVIGLCRLTNTNIAARFYSFGEIFIDRINGLYAPASVTYSIQKQYNSTNAFINFISNKADIIPCTFTYNGVKWAGFRVIPGAAQYYNARVYSTATDTPFIVKYYTTNTGTINNSEVHQSVVINGTDIKKYTSLINGLEIATVSSNVASANKLLTPRTFWGQSFDGTGNVSGAISGSTTGSFSSNLSIGGILTVAGTTNSAAINSYNVIPRANNTYQLGVSSLRWAGIYTQLLNAAGAATLSSTLTVGSSITAGDSIRSISGTISAGEFVDNKYGFINVTRTSTINNAACFSWVRSGVIAFALGFNTSNQIVMGQGSMSKVTIPWITIGSNTANVAGSFSANGLLSGSRIATGWDSGHTGAVSCSNWFRSKNSTGWYNETWGGGIYMTDATYVRVSHNKAFLIDGVAGATGIHGHHTSIRLYGAAHCGISMANSAYTWGIYSNNNGNMYIGRRTGSGTAVNGDKYVVCIGHDTFNMYGNIVATGEITAYSSSDIRLKENIQKLNALSFLRKINTYSFDWKENALSMKVSKHKHDQGFIAQEINKIAPHFVTKNLWGKGYLGIDKTKFIPYLVAGVNELDDEVSLLKKEVKALKEENIELRSLITSM